MRAPCYQIKIGWRKKLRGKEFFFLTIRGKELMVAYMNYDIVKTIYFPLEKGRWEKLKKNNTTHIHAFG